MSLKDKNETGIDGINISVIYNDDKFEEETLMRDTYANMRLAKCKRVIYVILRYDKNNEIIKIHLKKLSSSDEMFSDVLTMNLAEILRVKRGLKIETDSVGRNALCPCGSGKKYKKCCLRR